ncbi:MAG: hypothetical protein RL077_3371 [Verrucomicrobiota bacterium]
MPEKMPENAQCDGAVVVPRLLGASALAGERKPGECDEPDREQGEWSRDKRLRDPPCCYDM